MLNKLMLLVLGLALGATGFWFYLGSGGLDNAPSAKVDFKAVADQWVDTDKVGAQWEYVREYIESNPDVLKQLAELTPEQEAAFRRAISAKLESEE